MMMIKTIEEWKLELLHIIHVITIALVLRMFHIRILVVIKGPRTQHIILLLHQITTFYLVRNNNNNNQATTTLTIIIKFQIIHHIVVHRSVANLSDLLKIPMIVLYIPNPMNLNVVLNLPL